MLADLDASAFRWILAHRSPLLDPPMVAFSSVGTYAWLALAAVVGCAGPRRWPGIIQAVLAIVLSMLLTDSLVKPLVGRDRPALVHPDVVVLGVRPTSPSFPSTHASSAFAAAYSMSRAIPQAWAVVWPIAVMVACARVYVGVHYPLDVVFGGLVGLAVAAFVVGGTTWRATSISSR